MCISFSRNTHHADQHRDRRQTDEGHAARDGPEDQTRGRGARAAHVAAPAPARGDSSIPRQARLARRSRSHEDRQVILVDSSVWIDYFRGNATSQAEKLDSLLGTEPLAIGD